MTTKPNRDLTDEGRVAIRPTSNRLIHDIVEIPLVDRENTKARPAYVKSQTTLDRYKSRKTLTDEIFALRDEINLVAERTTFNGLSLLKSSLNTSAAVGTGALGTMNGAGSSSTGIVATSSIQITNIVTTNANVGKYNVVSTATEMTITAVQSTTGLTGVSQTISWTDIAVEERANLYGFTAGTIAGTRYNC